MSTIPMYEFECRHCNASFRFDENIGTSCAYVNYCPSCGRACSHDDWGRVES